MKNIFLFITIIFTMLLAFSGKSEAAFMVTPMEFHLSVESGDSATCSFRIKNVGKEEIRVKFYVQDFFIKPSGREEYYKAGQIEHSCAKWIEIAQEEMDLPAGQSQKAKFKINVPTEIMGDYWGIVFVEQTTRPEKKMIQAGKQNFNIATFQRVGVRIYQSIPNSKPGTGKISKVSVLDPADNPNPRIKEPMISVSFENAGETILKCKGRVEVRDEQGETIKEIELKDIRSYAKSTRNLTALIKEKLDPGQYVILAIVDYGGDYLVAGQTVYEVK